MVRIEVADAHSDEAQRLVAAYVAEIATTFAGGFDPTASVSAEPDEMSPPHGAFLVVRDDDGTAIGCGGVKLLDSHTAEIKRMWLAPAARGRGLGRLLLESLEEAARDLGATEGRLDTNGDLESALALYERSGWQRTAAYNDNAYATHWFRKSL
ncbi:MAG TPA: GNAT family N-acetyltransferase [Mycobacteriales bacterium]|nr:GNAT family N-acetyltransferase [Mycobacteriales bacterium]